MLIWLGSFHLFFFLFRSNCFFLMKTTGGCRRRTVWMTSVSIRGSVLPEVKCTGLQQGTLLLSRHTRSLILLLAGRVTRCWVRARVVRPSGWCWTLRPPLWCVGPGYAPVTLPCQTCARSVSPTWCLPWCPPSSPNVFWLYLSHTNPSDLYRPLKSQEKVFMRVFLSLHLNL